MECRGGQYFTLESGKYGSVNVDFNGCPGACPFWKIRDGPKNESNAGTVQELPTRNLLQQSAKCPISCCARPVATEIFPASLLTSAQVRVVQDTFAPLDLRIARRGHVRAGASSARLAARMFHSVKFVMLASTARQEPSLVHLARVDGLGAVRKLVMLNAVESALQTKKECNLCPMGYKQSSRELEQLQTACKKGHGSTHKGRHPLL